MARSKWQLASFSGEAQCCRCLSGCSESCSVHWERTRLVDREIRPMNSLSLKDTPRRKGGSNDAVVGKQSYCVPSVRLLFANSILFSHFLVVLAH